MSTAYTVLITGAKRGIGLEFVKQYAEAGWNVVACCREPNNALALQDLAKAYMNIQVCALDVADFKQIEQLATTLHDVSIDVLINNAGIYPNSYFGEVDSDAWLNAFKINSIAPLKMTEAFVRQLTRSQLKKVATLSSKMGSIADNGSGESYIYRSSKTAVNMVMKSLSIDLKPYGISTVTLHPGWVQTEMGGPNALINTETSVSGMRKVIDGLALENSGRFIAYDGQEIPW